MSATSHYINALRAVKRAGMVDDGVREVLDAITDYIDSQMPAPYGAGFNLRATAVLDGQEPRTARKADKSPAQRARGAQRPERHDRTESVAVVAERKGNKRSKAARQSRHCPECGKGGGFGQTFCNVKHDGKAVELV